MVFVLEWNMDFLTISFWVPTTQSGSVRLSQVVFVHSVQRCVRLYWSLLISRDTLSL